MQGGQSSGVGKRGNFHTYLGMFCCVDEVARINVAILLLREGEQTKGKKKYHLLVCYRFTVRSVL